MKIKRWLPFVLFLLFMAVVIACADGGRMPWFFNGVNNVPFGDKVGHVLLIGTLAFLFNNALSWRTVTLGRKKLQVGGLIILLLITAEEISQMWIPSRTFDLRDLAANYTGILLAELLSRRQQRAMLQGCCSPLKSGCRT